MWWESPPNSTQWKPDCRTCRETRAALCTRCPVENQPSGGPIGLERDMPTRHCLDDPRPRAEWPVDLPALALLVLTQVQWAARVPSSAHKNPFLWARQPPSADVCEERASSWLTEVTLQGLQCHPGGHTALHLARTRVARVPQGLN